MKLPRNAKVFRGQLDVAPFMGVFLLLLLLMVLRQQVTFVPGIPVELPEAADLSGVQGPAVTVVMDNNGQIYFDNRLLDSKQPDALRDFLRKAIETAGHPVTLILQADRKVELDAWTRLGMAAREAGIRNIQIVTQPLPGVQVR